MITITIRELMILVTIWFLWMATVAAILDWIGKRTIYKMEKEQEREKSDGCDTVGDEYSRILIEESEDEGDNDGNADGKTETEPDHNNEGNE